MHMLQWTAAVDDVDVAVPQTGQREVERAGGCARTRDTAGKVAGGTRRSDAHFAARVGSRRAPFDVLLRPLPTATPRTYPCWLCVRACGCVHSRCGNGPWALGIGH